MQLAELNDYQKSLIDARDREMLGLEPVERLGLETQTGAPDPARMMTIPPVSALPQDGRLVLEPDEHDLVMKWVRYQELFVIHAGTHEPVHALPPGWPDFTLVYADKLMLVEMKVRNRWRKDQLEMRAALQRQGTPVTVTRSANQTIFAFEAWLLLNFGWKPK